MEEKIKEMKNKTLLRYIAGKFWAPFFFALSIFAALVFLGDVFENLKLLSEGHATFRGVLLYCVYKLPYWGNLLVPLACLLGALFVISEMVSNGEWTACLAGGYRPLQLFSAILACVFIVTAINFATQETLVPGIERKAYTFRQVDLRGRTWYRENTVHDVAIRMSDNNMLFAKTIESKKGDMYDVLLDTYNDSWEVARQIVAKSLVWENGHWVFKNGVERTFDDGINIEERVFKEEPVLFNLKPKEIIVGKSEANTAGILELYKKINFLKKSGLVSFKEQTILHNRLAMPFVTILMCMLGMPFAAVVRKRGKIVNIILSLVMAFGFWTIMSMISTAGETGSLSPFIAGWGVSIACAVVVFIEYKLMKV